MSICGIYKLLFTGTDKVYIGQSINIGKRYKQHLSLLRANSASNKLQYAYDTFGVPHLEVLLECSALELDCEETEAINIFNSVDCGFNTLYSAVDMPKANNSGTNHGLSKYTKDQLIQVLHNIASTDLDYSAISKLTGVNYNTIASISAGNTHVWLKEYDLAAYSNMSDKKFTRNFGKDSNCLFKQGKPLPVVLSPEGVEFVVQNATKFARDNNIPKSTFRNILIGRAVNSKCGWRLKIQ